MGLVRDTENAEKNVISGESGDADSPEVSGPWPVNAPGGTRNLFVCRYLPTNKNLFLCALCASAVKVNNFMLCLIIIRRRDLYA
jgi:hypothetical protein